MEDLVLLHDEVLLLKEVGQCCGVLERPLSLSEDAVVHYLGLQGLVDFEENPDNELRLTPFGCLVAQELAESEELGALRIDANRLNSIASKVAGTV